jgi:EmrB/QacA subfamily drug resistance transporter
MIVLDTTIVNVALPSIRTDLGFSQNSLAWVVNAYILTFGGSLLIGGRLGDLYGPRRLFLIGLTVFTLSSLACGLAFSAGMLILARVIQGIGGAIVSAVSLSLMMNMFTDEKERARAMGFLGFIAAGGGSIGVLLGGILTTLNWHLIFLVNIPIGIAVFVLSLYLLPHSRQEVEHRHLDLGGAITITLSLLLLNYGVINGNAAGWLSLQTFLYIVSGIVCLLLFLRIESRVPSPLMPLRLFRLRNIWAANLIGVLWAAAMFAWFFLSALYMQLILHYTPLQIGLAFLPANFIMAAFSVGLSAKMIDRFGLRGPMAIGLALAALGLFAFARAPQNGIFLIDVLPAMLFLGFGAGMAFNPVLLSAMSDAGAEDSGLASGLVNTSFMMGGALGLAILASIAVSYTSSLVAAGSRSTRRTDHGLPCCLRVWRLLRTLAAVLGWKLIRAPRG